MCTIYLYSWCDVNLLFWFQCPLLASHVMEIMVGGLGLNGCLRHDPCLGKLRKHDIYSAIVFGNSKTVELSIQLDPGKLC